LVIFYQLLFDIFLFKIQFNLLIWGGIGIMFFGYSLTIVYESKEKPKDEIKSSITEKKEKAY